MNDPARRDRVISAVWTTMERQRFPDRPDLRTPAADVPGDTAIWNQRAYARAIEIAEAVLVVEDAPF